MAPDQILFYSSDLEFIYWEISGQKSEISVKFVSNIVVSSSTELQRRRAGQREVVQSDGWGPRGEGDGQLLHLQTWRAGERQEADQAPTTGNQRSGQSDTVNGGKMIYFWWGTYTYIGKVS